MFQNKVVAITGAASGIGRSLAIELASRGAHLAVSDFDAKGLEETMKLLPSGTDAKSYKVDVSSREAVFSFADDVLSDFGSVGFIVNNAGTSIMATVEHVTLTEMERVVNINLWGVIYGTKAFLPIMLKQREGCIVNVSSVFGLLATPCSVAYTISKYGVRGLTETLWQELGDTGVRAVVVHPGGVSTNISNVPKAESEGEFEKYMAEANKRMMVSSPDDVAVEIANGLENGIPRLLVGSGARELYELSLSHPETYGEILAEGMKAAMAAPEID